jgi:HK97 family phage major capsid protein
VSTSALETAAQQLAEKAMEQVEGKIQEKVTDAVTKAVAPMLEKHEQKTLELLSGNTSERDKTSQDVLRGWSRIPKESGYQPPQNPADLGLRGARVLRAFACCRGDANIVPRWIADQIKDKALADYVAKALETGTPSKGGSLVLEQHLAAEFYPLLRSKFSLMELGIRVVPMPSGNMTIAGMISGASTGWVGEAKKGTSSRPQFARRKLSSKKAYGNVVISTDLMEESDYSMDELIRDDLAAAMAETLYLGAIHGPGGENSPLGIDKDPGRTQVSIGAMLTSDHPTEFITALLKAKVDFDPSNAGWHFGPDVWKQFYNLKTTTGVYLFREEMDNGRLLGYPFRVSALSEIGSDANGRAHIFFGKWSELFMGVTRDLQFSTTDVGTVLDEDGNEVNAWDEELQFIKVTQKCDSLLRLSKCMAHSNNVWTIP